MKTDRLIERRCKAPLTPILQQIQGGFDLPDGTEFSLRWRVTGALPAKWSVGAIVGDSGSGKTTIARELFGDAIVPAYEWPKDKCAADGFPKSLGYQEITGLLSSVGFSDVPAWQFPFGLCSNGQQFRLTVARALAEAMADKKPKAIDEFGSYIDDKAARICAHAAAKAARRHNLQLIAITCREELLDWLEPDWAIVVRRPAVNGEVQAVNIEHNADGERRRWVRPGIVLRVSTTPPETWARFRHVHYLSHELHHNARCFVGSVDGEPAAFTAVMHFPGPKGLTYREHRTVCLPAYQGVGIGNRMSEMVAAMFVATGKPYFSTTSHPSMIRHRRKSPLWKCIRRPGMKHTTNDGFADAGIYARANSTSRITASFQFVGAADPEGARVLRVF